MDFFEYYENKKNNFLIIKQTFFQAPLTRDEATGFAGDICCASSRTAENIIKKLRIEIQIYTS